MKFHNTVCDMLAAEGTGQGELFAKARQTVMWHYQWMILHDFVERLCGEGTVARILHDGRKHYRFRKTPYMPIEFSVAAYRSEEHTSELQSLMRLSYAVFCLKNKNHNTNT